MSLILKAASHCAGVDLEKVGTIEREASLAGLGVVDDVLDRASLDEGVFLSGLAGEMG